MAGRRDPEKERGLPWRKNLTDCAGTSSLTASPKPSRIDMSARMAVTRQALERYDKAARYSLVVSIRAPEVDVDLCTEVANRIAVGVDAGL